MEEYFELRISEEQAGKVFSAAEGRRLGDLVRLVTIPRSDPRLTQVKRLQAESKSTSDPFFYGWRILRRYSRQEIESAELFHLIITTVFEPAGEECGTVYDETNSCRYVFAEGETIVQGFASHIKDWCGVGWEQTSDLILHTGRIPRKDIAVTIAGETVASNRFLIASQECGFTGFRRGTVRSKSSRSVTRSANTGWGQLIVNSSPVSATSKTRFGVGPFDPDENGKYRCPLGHIAGLSLQSEVSVARSEWDGSDFFTTKQRYGVRRGLLRPRLAILVTPRVRELWEREKLRGCTFEVAHFG